MAATTPIKLVIPTSINVLAMVNDTILRNRRKGFDATIDLPSLRRRAWMIVNETSVIPVADLSPAIPQDFTE